MCQAYNSPLSKLSPREARKYRREMKKIGKMTTVSQKEMPRPRKTKRDKKMQKRNGSLNPEAEMSRSRKKRRRRRRRG